jgi:Protein of unknown function (DUF1592)/Protein of unknown function (DUF1588)/Protein of unknown function (DUF1587)/Protein of unknown function (DUF1585)/Protein of unknown function (DUF1595)/Cytochrome C oxidase, cbb3-type, subunit III
MASSLRWFARLTLLLPLGLLALLPAVGTSRPEPLHADVEYKTVRPLVQKYCLSCHSTKLRKGSLDLERFVTTADLRTDLKPWQMAIEMLETAEMPPKGKLQPTDAERKELLAWVRGFLDAEARANAGDPGFIPLRRLSNAEYDATIRDLTGVDLRPTREFPADGAAGEGFTNAAEALTEVSPTLLTKYLNAAKEISEHGVLLPDGFRFSATKTRRDWTDESVAHIRQFYAPYTPDGRLPLHRYLVATVRHREALRHGKETVATVAQKENLHPKYLGILWESLTDKTPSMPLDMIRQHWREASEKDVPRLVAEIETWQKAVWRTVKIGSYVDNYKDNVLRQHPKDPAAVEMQSMRLKVRPPPGTVDVVLHLSARDLAASETGQVVWQRPRIEGGGNTLLLRDYGEWGRPYEIDLPVAFADTTKYLAAVTEAMGDRKLTSAELARKHGLDDVMLANWLGILSVNSEKRGRPVPVVPLQLLNEGTTNGGKPTVKGWHPRGTDLPVVVSNSSNETLAIPGRVLAHGVAVHPLPSQFVAVAWKSPITGKLRVKPWIAHAHPACGNGIAWWIEHRHGDRAVMLEEGTLDLGREETPVPLTVAVEKGDTLLLAVDARDGNHICDLTDIALSVTETNKPGRSWSLTEDVVDTILAGNPHADRHGNKETWSFVMGPARPVGKPGSVIPADSLLAKWRDAARTGDAVKLAEQVRALLTGPRPKEERDPNRLLYDRLVTPESPIFQGVPSARLVKLPAEESKNGLKKELFDADGSLTMKTNAVTVVRLPALAFRNREFVVEGKLPRPSGDRVVRFEVALTPPRVDAPLDGTTQVVGSPAGAAYRALIAGREAFRRVFPEVICFPQVIPTDEVVCLKMYHREDELLGQLFLDDAQKQRLERLWEEHRFISRWPVAEYKYLPQFIGFVTQDQPKELVTYFEGKREPFRKRAEAFEKEAEAAIPAQMKALLDFADRAYRRPLTVEEKEGFQGLYAALRKKGVSHDEAFRGTLARVLVAPAFLFRIEVAPVGKEAKPVNDWELATRLSYFLWSSMPDAELRALAEQGKLRDPKTLTQQAKRMLRDARVRSLAIEFGTQWIHVRGFNDLKEKNEKLFPTFTPPLRDAIYEESILFFQDLFQSDRPVTTILDADHTYLNEPLAKHYGIPGVSGPAFRRMDGVKKYGRGGVLGLASVQARQSGASRTSPVLRGNWVVETLLGEKLPRPPADVPQLPDQASGTDGLTTRQLVEKHISKASCAACHQRIDPFGFALESFDPIGRRIDRADTHARLKDGTEFDGIDGLRTYLLTKKKDVLVRLFCKRLLGYALGRAVTLSDAALVEEMTERVSKKDGTVADAILAILESKQFRSIRGSDFAKAE